LSKQLRQVRTKIEQLVLVIILYDVPVQATHTAAKIQHFHEP